ncbi:MAG TPA: hypothetical protein VFH46_02305 [Pyrinomonadaceae bacterium]|nr:hypothetical protein [Pyrinomonadaceae bacterium]
MRERLPEVRDRRDFIKTVSAFGFGFLVAPIGQACSEHRATEKFFATQRPSQIEVAGSQEPGTRILLHGTIVDLEGTPIPQVKLFLYHTDATGYYSRPVNNPRRARLNGTLWSDARGQYSVSTIKPAHYGDVDPAPPMHIHVHLQPPNLPDHWVDSFYFEGDPRLRPEDIARGRELGRFSNVVSLAPDSASVLKAVRDFRVDPALAERNQLSDGWYR